MPDEAAVIAVIDDFLDTRNRLIGYKTETEKVIEEKISQNVNFIKKKSDYEELEGLIEDNERLSELNYDESARLREREDYQEIRNLLISSSSKKEIIQNALEIACSELQCQLASIFLFSSKDELLKRAGLQGKDLEGKPIPDDWLDGEAYRLGESFIGRAAQHKPDSKYGETQVSYNFNNEDLNNKDEYLRNLGELRCAIAVPLNGRNKTYGVLRVINKIDSNNLVCDSCFSDADLALISFLGGAIAAAISNFHGDARNEILRYLRDSMIDAEYNNDFNYSKFYKRVLEFSTGSETAFKVAILRVKNDVSKAMEVRCFVVSDGVTERKDNGPRRLDQGFVGLVSESRKPKIVEKITESGMLEKFMNPEWVKENQLESFGCFPLVLPYGQQEVIGTLSLFAGYEYEFHSSIIDFLNNVISSVTVLVQKEKKAERVRKKFLALSEQWLNETGFMSSVSEAVIHPAYQQIIGMGEEVIPLLLEELSKASGRWFWALRSITGEDPVPEVQRGKTKEMINSWIDWGKKKGYTTVIESIQKI